jgi:ATP-dependent DNA helicase RecQ
MLRQLQDSHELEPLLDEYEDRRHADRERLKLMMHYAQSAACRTRLLQEYFGDSPEEDCGHCDNCQAHAEGKPAPALDKTSLAMTGQAAVNASAGAATPAMRQPAWSSPAPTARFRLAQRVVHRRFGLGEVVAVEDANVSVHFERAGVKRIQDRYLRPVPAAKSIEAVGHPN